MACVTVRVWQLPASFNSVFTPAASWTATQTPLAGVHPTGRELRSKLDNIEGEHGIRIIHKSQDERAKRAAGGVAIAFRTGNGNLRKRELKNRKDAQEILYVTGKIGKGPRKVAVMVVYVPPDTKAVEHCGRGVE